MAKEPFFLRRVDSAIKKPAAEKAAGRTGRRDLANALTDAEIFRIVCSKPGRSGAAETAPGGFLYG